MDKLLCLINIALIAILAGESTNRPVVNTSSGDPTLQPAEIYFDRPIINASSGDLTLQPAKNGNLYFNPYGPRSGVYVGNVNILNIIASLPTRDQTGCGNDTTGIKTPKKIQRKLDMLENQLHVNFTALSRLADGLRLRIVYLEHLMRHRLGCLHQSCANGGTCIDTRWGYYCHCPSNWEGINCDIDVNECRNFEGTDLGCQNEATCINKVGSYECVCKAGWYGIHCTRKLKDCSGGHFEMCGHGTCIGTTSGEGITCTCDQGWTSNGTGLPCLSDVDECDAAGGARCSTNPRVECVNLPGSFRCGECPAGYSGDGFSCTSIDIDE